jgi:hypothetical protein
MPSRAKSKAAVPPLRVPLTSEQKAAIRKQRPPSKASLREMPEVDFSTGFVRRGPGALQEVLAHARTKRGRPKKGEVAAGSSARSVRLSDAEWTALDRLADRQRTTVHALLREAVADKLHKAG